MPIITNISMLCIPGFGCYYVLLFSEWRGQSIIIT